jgi:CHAT domain-containing protein
MSKKTMTCFIYRILLGIFFLSNFPIYSAETYSETDTLATIQELIKLGFEQHQNIFLHDAYRKVIDLKIHRFQDILAPCLAEDDKQSSDSSESKYEASTRSSLFFPSKAITIKDIQEKYLVDDQALVDYIAINNCLYTFVIRQDTFQVAESHLDISELNSDIAYFLIQLYTNKNPLELTFDIKLAHALYQKLIKPIEPLIDGMQSLIIIPDTMLIGLPFECLVVDPKISKEENNDNSLYHEFNDIKYLINDYAVAYNYSFATWNLQTRSAADNKKIGRFLLTMSEVKALDKIQQDKTLRGWTIASNYYSHEEVQRISLILWLHKNLRGDQVTESFFTKNCANFRWIHLAIPVLLNSESPCASQLFFSQKDNTLSNNKLLISEITHCALRSDLLTMTGCEIRPIPSLNKNGVLALPMAFLLAGSQSVLFNLWRVNDLTVSYFFSKFYWELKYKRQTGILALNQAKLRSLKTTFSYRGKEISRAHPYFWAPYMLFGNVNLRPPTFSLIPPKTVIIITYIAVAVLSILVVQRTKKKVAEAKSSSEAPKEESNQEQ